MSVNKVILIGNVGAEPKIIQMDGYKIANLSLATGSKNKEGELVTQWHNVSVTNKNADFVDMYVDVGNKIYIEGYLKYNTVEDEQGNKKYFTEIRAYKLQKMTPKSEQEKVESTKDSNVKQMSSKKTPSSNSFHDDEIPF